MKTLEEAIAERDKFLEENPHLKPVQEKIDETLDKTPTAQRMEVLSIMMTSNLVLLQSHLMQLVKELKDAKEN